MCRLANPRRSGSLLPGLVLFVAVVWLVVACLQTATEMDWLGPGPRTNRELGIDARALFYTEIDLDTPKPVIGMMPDAPSSGREQ